MLFGHEGRGGQITRYEAFDPDLLGTRAFPRKWSFHERVAL